MTRRYTLAGIPVQTKLLPRAERRASILRGAAAAFARSGFAHTSMDDVAAACGVTKVIVYRHFETKEDLYRAVLQSVFARLADELRSARQTAGSPSSTAGFGVRLQLTVAREDPNGYTLLWRHAAREPMFADYAADARSTAVAVVRRLLHLDSGDDVFDQWTAEVTFTWLVDATLAWLDHGTPDRDSEYLERTTAAFRAVREAWASLPSGA